MSAFGQSYAQIIMSGRYQQLAVWFIDMRNFRSINPKYGFLGGNKVLQVVVRAIRECLCHELPIARLGGDRFVAITSNMDFDQAKEAFAQLNDTINMGVREFGITQPIILCGGVHFLTEEQHHVPSFQQPMDYSSIAHRKAHDNPKSTLERFTQEDLERDMRRMAIEQTVDEALETGQIEVWYQPQVDYILDEIVGAEALARWHHPELGWISPKEFIPVLEECGKIHELDLYVWHEACRSAGKWYNQSDGKPVPISVNVSRMEMYEPGLLEHFLELQRKYDLPDGSLRLEVTESAFSEGGGRLYQVVESMRNNHMMVEMDDFGSGLSSLTMLKDVPVDVVKLDMGFLQSSMSEDRGGVVLGSIIRMLQGLDTPIIAEGVETLEQAEMLKNMGCHLMQGYHFARPMPLVDFEQFVIAAHTTAESDRRTRVEAHLDDLMSFDSNSSYLFNHAVGGMLYFFASSDVCESILVNDQFYEECGLHRNDFGNKKINPIQEIEGESRDTLWRAAAEAREHGAALCRAEVRLTGRWIDCVMRFIGKSSRGNVYSMNIVRSGTAEQMEDRVVQKAQDLSWNMDMLNLTVPNSFVKCDLSDTFDMSYIGQKIYEYCGLSQEEFSSRFHNSLLELVVPEDRQEFIEAVRDSQALNTTFSCDVRMHYGYGIEFRETHVFGRIRMEGEEEPSAYALIMFTGEPTTDDDMRGTDKNGRMVRFEYDMVTDTLTLYVPVPGGEPQEVIREHWLTMLETSNDRVSTTSRTKLLASIRDLREHPVAGFADVKCSLHEGESLRWYHMNYTCEADETGHTRVIRGYAHDANDQMGSARWWRRQAETDQLTALLNRNAATQEINLAMRSHGLGMMFMVDLDGFKRVNDELGHLTGDALLREVANALRESFREGDVLARYGGDEFVAFVPLTGGNPREIAERRAERIIEAIESIDVGDGTHAACSVGVAICHDREATFYDLLQVADETMYQSKLAGKGRYTITEM